MDEMEIRYWKARAECDRLKLMCGELVEALKSVDGFSGMYTHNIIRNAVAKAKEMEGGDGD